MFDMKLIENHNKDKQYLPQNLPFVIYDGANVPKYKTVYDNVYLPGAAGAVAANPELV